MAPPLANPLFEAKASAISLIRGSFAREDPLLLIKDLIEEKDFFTRYSSFFYMRFLSRIRLDFIVNVHKRIKLREKKFLLVNN